MYYKLPEKIRMLIIAIVGTFNFTLTELLHVHHRIAWATCLIVTAIISLCYLKKIVFKPVEGR
jgi:hypothetical protein